MIPHPSEICVKNVESLSESWIRRNFENEKIYKKTRFLVLKKGKRCRIVEVRKKKSSFLFSRIIGMKFLAEARWLEKEIDVMDKGEMAELSAPLVVKGKYGYVSFIFDEVPAKVEVVDVVPPFPSRLFMVAKECRKHLKKSVILREKLIDLRKYAGKNVIFPCSSSGIGEIYLDDFPDLKTKNVTLVGCSLSKKIFIEVYGEEPKFIDICPKKFAGKGRKLIRCCDAKKVEVEGEIAIVPWSAEPKDVLLALKILTK
jgi:hypothetical protein